MKLKHVKIVPLLLAFCIFACKKERTTLSDSIIGTWELRISVGGQGRTTSYKAGNGNYFRLACVN